MGCSGALAVDTEAIFPSVVGLNFFEAWVGGISHLSAANVGEASFGELCCHPFVIPHPEMTGASEDSGGDGFQSSRNCRFAKPCFLHEAGAGGGSGVSGIDPDQLFEVREHKAKGAAGTKVGEDVSDGDTELVESHVLENVGAVDRLCRSSRDRKALDDVAVFDVFGVGRKTFFDQ